MVSVNEVFRDFATDGLPSSGAHKPKKTQIRELLNAFQNGDADGIYDFIPASNVGAGTANAIEATTSVAIPDTPNGALIALPIIAENTASPVTVAFNGGAALTVKNVDGSDPQSGDLTAGMIVAGYVSGSTFRFISDPSSVHNKDAAEAAQAASEVAETGAQTAQSGAEAARDIAAGYASDSVSQGNVPIYATVSGMSALEVPAGINAIRTNGYSAAGDGGGALYKRSLAEPAYHPKFQDADQEWFEMERGTPLVSLKKFGAKGEATNDTVAIQRALASGEDLFIPAGLFYFDQLLWPSREGQRIQGAGKYRSVLQNPYNAEPLFITGDPTRADGAMDYITLRDFALLGYQGSENPTLWGLFLPSSDEYEGVNASPNNYYYGTRPFDVTWTGASRNCLVENVTVRYVYGEYAAHVSSWCNKFNGVNLWSSQRGLRNAGDANNNGYRGLYISSMGREGIIHPSSPLSIPTATVYSDLVVQQCGADDDGRGAVVFNKDQGTVVQGLYLERNNEKTADTHIYIDVSSIGASIAGVRVRDDDPDATIIHNAGQGTKIGTVVASGPVTGGYKTVVLHDGTDSRSSTIVDGPIQGVDGAEPNTTDGAITAVGANANLYTNLPGRTEGYGLSSAGDKFYKDGNKVGLRADGSTSRVLALESSGGMRFEVDIDNLTDGGDFEWFHNGEDGNGELLLLLDTNGGHLVPGADGTQHLGFSSKRFDGVHANSLRLSDGVAAPGAVTGMASLYVDAADGDLKIKFADGTIKTIMTDTA